MRLVTIEMRTPLRLTETDRKRLFETIEVAMNNYFTNYNFEVDAILESDLGHGDDQ